MENNNNNNNKTPAKYLKEQKRNVVKAAFRQKRSPTKCYNTLRRTAGLYSEEKAVRTTENNKATNKNNWVEDLRERPEKKHSKEKGAIQSAKNKQNKNNTTRNKSWEEEDQGKSPKWRTQKKEALWVKETLQVKSHCERLWHREVVFS